ncbi:MAG TPA: Uma2 family endonuclease [Lamprocystis sp. (in: g-proteobacteria)]|nr:Uma2 family endonuclease [Lamprocystis sp. (in: g-proteobacteria)]
MSALQPLEPLRPPDRIDQRVTLHGVRWQDYEALLAIRGESNATRVTYLDGELELMSPSFDHETLKKTLGRLIETYADERGIDLIGCGSWTVRKEGEARGAEADECYVLGPIQAPPDVPDLACEVIWTSGGIDKLEVYRGLGVPEVWFWQGGALRNLVLAGDAAYHQALRSRLLPGLDPDLIVRFMSYPSQAQAVRGLREALRSGL